MKGYSGNAPAAASFSVSAPPSCNYIKSLLVLRNRLGTYVGTADGDDDGVCVDGSKLGAIESSALGYRLGDADGKSEGEIDGVRAPQQPTVRALVSLRGARTVGDSAHALGTGSEARMETASMAPTSMRLKEQSSDRGSAILMVKA